MKKHLILTIITAVFCVISAVSANASKSTTSYDTHPVEIGGNDCLYCHDANSKAEEKSSSNAGKEWNDSLHGINMVPCSACHGDEKTFLATSSIDNCISCHPGESATIKRKTKVVADRIVCVNCHTAHTFTAPKEDKPVHTK